MTGHGLSLYESAWPTRDEFQEITARCWGARSSFRLQLATVLRASSEELQAPYEPEYSDAQLIAYARRRMQTHLADARKGLMWGKVEWALDRVRAAKRELDGIAELERRVARRRARQASEEGA